MSEPTRAWTDEALEKDDVSKKDILTFLQENASQQFQVDHKLKGKNAAKSNSKPKLIEDYKLLFESKAFKTEGEAELKAVTKDTENLTISKKSDKDAQPASEVKERPKYTKKVLKCGDKTSINYPQKGDTVEVFYTGKLPDGTMFDSNVIGLKRGKKPQALSFRLGKGAVIRGWDEVLLTMRCQEKCEVVVEAEWAYGKKGLERGKNEVSIPPNTPLTFEIELHRYI